VGPEEFYDNIQETLVQNIEEDSKQKINEYSLITTSTAETTKLQSPKDSPPLDQAIQELLLACKSLRGDLASRNEDDL
jgi:hypothetical protein